MFAAGTEQGAKESEQEADIRLKIFGKFKN